MAEWTITEEQLSFELSGTIRLAGFEQNAGATNVVQLRLRGLCGSRTVNWPALLAKCRAAVEDARESHHLAEVRARVAEAEAELASAKKQQTEANELQRQAAAARATFRAWDDPAAVAELGRLATAAEEATEQARQAANCTRFLAAGLTEARKLLPTAEWQGTTGQRAAVEAACEEHYNEVLDRRSQLLRELCREAGPILDELVKVDGEANALYELLMIPPLDRATDFTSPTNLVRQVLARLASDTSPSPTQTTAPAEEAALPRPRRIPRVKM